MQIYIIEAIWIAKLYKQIISHLPSFSPDKPLTYFGYDSSYNVLMGNIYKPPLTVKNKEEIAVTNNQAEKVAQIQTPQYINIQVRHPKPRLQEDYQFAEEFDEEDMPPQDEYMQEDLIEQKNQVVNDKKQYSQVPQIYLMQISRQEEVESSHFKASPQFTQRTNVSQQLVIDREKSSKILKELVVQNIPHSQVKHVKNLQRRRISILWLKQGAGSQKQKERDAVLIQKGYQLFTSHQITHIKQKYEQSNLKGLKLYTILLFSYSDYYNNQETIKQLFEYFVQDGKTNKIFVVKPPQQGQYQMHLGGLRSSKNIVQFSYPIEYIRQKISQFQVSEDHNSINIIPLKIWEGVNGLFQAYHDYSLLDGTLVKAKVSLAGCLKIGFTIIDQLEEKTYFKSMLKIYSFFHDLYLSDSSLMKAIDKNENYLERIGIKLLQDPINFYMNPTHQITINRMLKYVVDIPECLNNIILPLNLLFYKIKEEYRKDCQSKNYQNHFICFYEMSFNIQQLKNLQKGVIFQNLGFIKAYLKQYDLKRAHSDNPANVLLIINVRPIHKSEQSDNGYYFVGSNPVDINEENHEKKLYFTGFSYALFNLLNSFMVTNRYYDVNLKKHIIEVQYGYIASQIYKKNIVNYISAQEYAPRYLAKMQESQVDYEAIIKYQSNKLILDKIEDQGDRLTLLTRYNDSIAYYDAIFAKCKTEISQDVFLLSNFQNKKGINYQLGKSSQNALQYFYNAFNFIRKTRQYSQIQLNVIKCLQAYQQYQKMISFSQTLVQIAIKYKFLDKIDRQFLLKLYGLISKGHFLKNSVNFELKREVPQIMKNYESGLVVIQQIGEYNPSVPQFYYNLGTYYLSIGKSFDSLVYLNKALIINMTILTQHHPHLCQFYQILSVAYVAMHDYAKALSSINSAFLIYAKYYEKTNYRFIAIYEMRGKIFALMNNISSSIQAFESQQQVIDHYVVKKKYVTPLERKHTINNPHIGLFNFVEERQLTPYFKPSFRKDKSQICKVFVLIYRSKLFQLECKFKQAIELLKSALNLNRQELGQANLLNVQLLYLIINLLISSLNWKETEKTLKQTFQLLIKLRKDNEVEAARFYQLFALLQQQRRDYGKSIKYLIKMKEIYFRLYSRNSLENCMVSSDIGRIHLKVGSHQQAKAYFLEHQNGILIMRLKAKNSPQSTKLIGVALEDYVKKIQIELCVSLENKGMLLQACGNIDDALVMFQQAIQNLKAIVGEYNPKVAKIIYRLGACFLKKGTQECDHLLKQLKKSLSIFKSVDIHNLNDQKLVHLALSKAYETKNQLPSSIDELGHALILLRTMHKVSIDLVEVLVQLNRLVDIVISQPTLNYLKNTYFILAKLFSEEKDYMAESRQGLFTVKYPGEYQDKIINQIKSLLNKQESIQKQIQNIQTQQIREQKDLLKRLEQKQHFISLPKIKENFQIRKKLREKVKN